MTKSITTAAVAPSSPSVASSSNLNVVKKRLAVNKSEVRKKRQTTMLKSTLKSDKYPNVHHNKLTGRWQAWTNCMPGTPAWGPSRGPYCGSHATEYLAARAQDRALLKLKRFATMPIRLNFPKADYADDEPLRATLRSNEFVQLLALEGRGSYRKVGATKCLKKFLAEEEALGNLPNVCEEGERKYKVTSLNDYLVSVLGKRPNTLAKAVDKLAAELANPAAELTTPLTDMKWGRKRVRSSRLLGRLLSAIFHPSEYRARLKRRYWRARYI